MSNRSGDFEDTNRPLRLARNGIWARFVRDINHLISAFSTSWGDFNEGQKSTSRLTHYRREYLSGAKEAGTAKTRRGREMREITAVIMKMNSSRETEERRKLDVNRSPWSTQNVRGYPSRGRAFLARMIHLRISSEMNFRSWLRGERWRRGDCAIIHLYSFRHMNEAGVSSYENS